MCTSLSSYKARGKALGRTVVALIAVSALTLGAMAGVSDAQTPAAPSDGKADAANSVTGRPLPRFAAIGGEVARMRRGPGFRYPIEWIYQKRGLPIQIIAEYETWRKVRDWKGDQGWMHATLLTGKRMVIFVGQRRDLRAAPEENAETIARAEPGVLGELLKCEKGSAWCGVRVNGHSGWVKRGEIWGVDPDEVFPRE